MTFRFQELIRQTTPTTLAIIAICCTLHLLLFIVNYPELHTLTLCPQCVIYQGDAYRIVTSALFHVNFLHIAMNMMSTAAIGAVLEKRIGTIPLLITIMWSILLTSIIQVTIAILCFWFLDMEYLMRQHSVGFSGVIFHLSVLECNLGPQQARNVFGFFHVSPKLYPWVLLVIMQVIMPGVSFTGHLVGILAGHLQYFQFINFLFPSEAYFRELDSWSILSPVTKLPSYVRTPTTDVFPRDAPPTTTSCFCTVYRTTTRLLHDLLETLWFIAFGRGAEINSNIAPRLQLLPLFSSPRHNSSDNNQHERLNKHHPVAEEQEPLQRQDV
ncbi:hypothetical protein ACA910_000240 [Epithemia clementina (nom. ined.)]